MMRKLDVLGISFVTPLSHLYLVLNKLKNLSKTKVGGGMDPSFPPPPHGYAPNFSHLLVHFGVKINYGSANFFFCNYKLLPYEDVVFAVSL